MHRLISEKMFDAMQVMNHPTKNLSNRRNSLFRYPRESGKKERKKKRKKKKDCPQTMEFYSVKNFHRVALILSNYTTPLPAPVIFRNITESRGEEPAGHDGGSSANRFSNGKRKNFEEMEGNLCSL